MRDEPLPTLYELLQEAKELLKADFTFTEAECFVDAFQNGEFHEEEPDLIHLTDRLSERELASLYLPVCKAMISGSVHHREGPTLKLLMDCYTALAKWQRKHLSSPEEVVSALERVRPLIFSEVIENRSTWWSEVFHHFEMLEAGIRRRMGVSHLKLSDEYRSVEHKLNEVA